jgi:hypothetical protein
MRQGRSCGVEGAGQPGGPGRLSGWGGAATLSFLAMFSLATFQACGASSAPSGGNTSSVWNYAGSAWRFQYQRAVPGRTDGTAWCTELPGDFEQYSLEGRFRVATAPARASDDGERQYDIELTVDSGWGAYYMAEERGEDMVCPSRSGVFDPADPAVVGWKSSGSYYRYTPDAVPTLLYQQWDDVPPGETARHKFVLAFGPAPIGTSGWAFDYTCVYTPTGNSIAAWRSPCVELSYLLLGTPGNRSYYRSDPGGSFSAFRLECLSGCTPPPTAPAPVPPPICDASKVASLCEAAGTRVLEFCQQLADWYVVVSKVGAASQYICATPDCAAAVRANEARAHGTPVPSVALDYGYDASCAVSSGDRVCRVECYGWGAPYQP